MSDVYEIKNMGLISVIVPIYNIRPYISKCVNSILAQTYRSLEIILVDDGSTDGCAEICDEYAAKDDRIKVIHKPNGGLSEARNYGLDVAGGGYLGFVDGDDWIHPQMYEILLSVLIRDDVSFAACAYERVDESFADRLINVSDMKSRILTGTQAMRSLDDTVQAMAWNKLYRRELFDGIRYPIGRLHEDEFIVHELLYGSDRIALIDDTFPLYFYTDREESIMSRLTERRIRDSLAALKGRVDFCVSRSWSEVIPDVIDHFCNLCINRYYLVSDALDVSSDDKRRIMDLLWQEERDMVRTHRKYDIGKAYRKFAASPQKYLNYLKLDDVIGRFRKSVFGGEN